MPFSSGINKEFIREVVRPLKAKKVLDIGAGQGNNVKRYRTNGQKWTGIEIWQPYVKRYGLDEKYEELTVADARTLDYGEDTYDLAFAGDVLEHMDPQDAAELLAKLRRAAKVVITQIPLGHYPQGEWEGNPHEAHVKDDWTLADVFSLLGPTDEYKCTEESKGTTIGTFVYRRDAAKRPIKIAVYAIAKNEAQFVKPFCESAADADYIVIGDTGCTDDTVALTKAYANTITYPVHIKPWRFDLARNAILAMVPADTDVCISLDMDEQLTPGWRAEIERLWIPDTTTRMRYLFDWGAGIKFHYEKIHHRAGYHWHHPCHEYPRKDPRVIESLAISDRCLVTHHPDPTKSRGQYMDLLWVATEEDPHCPRNAFYYARELTFNARWDDAIEALNRYMNLPAKLWPHEVSYAHRLMGDALEATGKWNEALKWYRTSCAETPDSREPWFGLAQACYRRRAWGELFGATSRLFEIKNRELVYTVQEAVWGWEPHDLHALAAYNIGLYSVAVEHGKIAVDLNPNEQRLQDNLKFYMEKLTQT